MPNISGLASGMDTDAIIDKLIKIESQPIQRLEREIKELQTEQQAWNQVLAKLKTLNRQTRVLYSVNTPFGNKVVESSDKSVIQAIANRYADKALHKFHIIEIAGNHKISSDPVAKSRKLKKGLIVFEVNSIKRSVFFNGGTLQDLFNSIAQKTDKILSAGIIKKDEKSSVLTLESKISGAAGAIEIDDPDGILKSIGIEKKKIEFKGNWNINLALIKKGSSKIDQFYKNFESAYEGRDFWFWDEKSLYELQKKRESLLSSNPGKLDLLTIKGKSHFQFPLQKEKITILGATKLELKLRSDFLPPQPQSKPSLSQKEFSEKPGERSVEVYKKSSLDVNGVLLETPSVIRKEKLFNEIKERELQQHINTDKNKIEEKVKKPEEYEKSSKGKIVLNFSDGSKQEYSYEANPVKVKRDKTKTTYQSDFFTLSKELFPHKGKELKNVELIQEEGVSSIIGLALKTPKAKTSRIQYKNQISDARDAQILYGGVKITRTKNRGLDDIVKGLTIDLLKESSEEITLAVDVDVDSPRKAIETFMKSYNDFLILSENLQTSSVEKELGNFRRQKQKSGILAGDSTIQRLASDLRLMVSNSFPNNSKDPVRILYQLGISTGKVGASIADNRKGHLKIIDEEKLLKQLRENYESVKQFFGSDSTGDRKIDSGFAFHMFSYVRNYTQSGRYGLIQVKVQLAEDRIKMSKKSIEKLEMHLASYRNRLKRSFQAMEQGLLRTKSEQRWLNSQLKGMSGSAGDKEK